MYENLTFSKCGITSLRGKERRALGKLAYYMENRLDLDLVTYTGWGKSRFTVRMENNTITNQ